MAGARDKAQASGQLASDPARELEYCDYDWSTTSSTEPGGLQRASGLPVSVY